MDENGYLSPGRVLTVLTIVSLLFGALFTTWPALLSAANIARRSRVQRIEATLDSIREANRRQSRTLDRLECFARANASDEEPAGCWR